MQPALPLVRPVEPRTLGVAAIILTGAILSPIPQRFRDVTFPASPSFVSHAYVTKKLFIQDIKQENKQDIIYDNKNNSISKEYENQGYEQESLITMSIIHTQAISEDVPYVDTFNGGDTQSLTTEMEEDLSEKEEELSENSSEKLSNESSPQDIQPKNLPIEIVNYSLTWQGVPYRYGGQSRDGIDCSALVQSVYNKYGIPLPRTAREQFREGVGIPKDNLLPGDLVFFSTNGPGASHVGIYLGEGNFLSATRRRVEIKSLEDPYWQKYYRGSRRILD